MDLFHYPTKDHQRFSELVRIFELAVALLTLVEIAYANVL